MSILAVVVVCPYEFKGFGAMDGNFPFEFIRLEVTDGNFSYEIIGLSQMACFPTKL